MRFNPISIRTGQAEERATLEDLQRRASLANPGDRETLLAHPDAISLPEAFLAAGQVHVAERGGAIVGFTVIRPRDDGDYELEGLFVEPEQWRTGVGTALITHVTEIARSAGANGVVTIGNDDALPFYVAFGFGRIGTAETRFRPAPLLRLDIP
ncbi:MAG: GNAT family N-acetyltransferase [Bauldia sp.]|nr:GNAT family N-acetyltransferase [Bauldia sp.]